MTPLDSTLRSALEKAIIAARDQAEYAARAALDILAVNEQRAFGTLTSEQRAHRNALRAKARQLGSGSLSDGFSLLVEEVAYVQWHRMLFPRFLAENDLLIHPSGVAVTLEECEELASEEGDPDRWATAARYAGRMLPGIFPSDDPSGQVTFAPEGLATLEATLSTLPSPVFTSDDGLGWVYQFWQSKKKKEVSSSGRKIEKLDLAAYSQLFTEDFMVRFLLENSLGAWWAAQHPNSPLVKDFKYLRFREDGAPAAGTFPGWPKRAVDITVMDPCCGSGHFLLVAFEMLREMRMEEEGFGELQAAEAVLRDNLFGLEIDPRCVQIAAFALALAAWKTGGYRKLPLPNVACSGIAVRGQLEAWTELAGDDTNMRQTLERLHGHFANAPDLGSLIDPTSVPIRERMFAPDFGEVSPLLEGGLAREGTYDPVAAVFGSAALGVARAAGLLARRYTLVATNVPYLARGKQGDVLKDFLDRYYPSSRANLATAFIERCKAFVMPYRTYALVTPQNWLFLGRYEKLRRQLLQGQTWHTVISLGPRAFETISGEVVNVSLQVLTDSSPDAEQIVAVQELDTYSGAMAKSAELRTGKVAMQSQREQNENPDARFVFGNLGRGLPLGNRAISPRGIVSGDAVFWTRVFWELPRVLAPWRYLQSTVKTTLAYGGREHIINWETGGLGMIAPGIGNAAYGRHGVAISLLGPLHATLYSGDLYDNNTGVIVPSDEALLSALWAYCSSSEFGQAVRKLDRKMNVTNATLVKVPFDFERWRDIAGEKWPTGLPSPRSVDPTQWLFKGNPAKSMSPLHVAAARLMGYRWPQQEPDKFSRLSISDAILPLVPVAGQEPAVERLRRVLSEAYGDDWSAEQQTQLLHEVGFGAKGLDAWLRDGIFEQHCKLFHQRPFIWHIWDGRRDGFSALVNYHKLDAANLDKLIYTYLGEWIRTQRSAEESGTPGASTRLVAALELQKELEHIRDGEPPYDIYVRWKPLHEQPMGWNPNLNDGVRLNIRPFVAAGILRSRVNVNWKKDPGRNADGSERINDLHYTLAQKRTAREAKTD